MIKAFLFGVLCTVSVGITAAVLVHSGEARAGKSKYSDCSKSCHFIHERALEACQDASTIIKHAGVTQCALESGREAKICLHRCLFYLPSSR